MIGRIIGRKTTVPDLVVSQRVIDKMIEAAKSYLEDETGEALVGLVVHNAHSSTQTLYVLDTIAPDASAIRHYATFQQGDERQDEILYWWRENWRGYRAALKLDNPLQAKWNVPLMHLGDWHKQPGMMIHPSGGDLATALEWISDEDNKLHFMIAPIVTLGTATIEQDQTVSVNYQTFPLGDGATMRVDWWYIDLKSRGFLPINPAIYPSDSLPAMPAEPWHLTDEARFDLECRRLKEHGLFLSLTLWDSDQKPPLEVCLLAARADWEHMLLLVTPPDYPAAPPSARIAPFIPMSGDEDLFAIFERAWAQSKPVEAQPSTWDADHWLIDFVKTIAADHHLPIDVQMPPAAEIPPIEAQSAAAPLAVEGDTPSDTPSASEAKSETASPAISEAAPVESSVDGVEVSEAAAPVTQESPDEPLKDATETAPEDTPKDQS
ncbi:MAG: hypothetical protein U0670_17235 [Anaerolineae bacterium]